jgi:hypothetical protein
LAVYEVLLGLRLLRLFISWKSSTWVVDFTMVLFTAQFYPDLKLAFLI